MMKFLVPQGLRPAGRFLYIGFKKKRRRKEYDYDEEKTYIALGNGRGDDAVAWLLRCR